MKKKIIICSAVVFVVAIVIFMVTWVPEHANGTEKETPAETEQAKEFENETNSVTEIVQVETEEREGKTFIDDVMQDGYFNSKYNAILRDDGSMDVMYEGTMIRLESEEWRSYLNEVSEVLKKYEVDMVNMLIRSEARGPREQEAQPRERGKWSFNGAKAAYEFNIVDEVEFLKELNEVFQKYVRDDTLQ